MKMEQIGIAYGPLYDDIEDQVRKQGYTLPNCNKYEELRTAINRLMFASILTESEVERAFKKLNKQIAQRVEPLERTAESD